MLDKMINKIYFKLFGWACLLFFLHGVLNAQTCEGPLSVQMIGSTSADSLVVSVDVTGITCSSDANGALVLSVDGGNPDYDYSWEDEMTTVDSVRFELAEGVYTVTVTDELGCTEILSLTIEELNLSNTDLIEEDGCGACWIDNGERTYFFGPDTKYIAELTDETNDMINLEATEVCVYVDEEVNTCQNNPYLQRHWSVDPNVEENACIKLFFKQEELENLAASIPGESTDFRSLIDNSRLCLTALSGGNENCDDFESETIYSMAASPPLEIIEEDPVKEIWSVKVCTNKFATFYLNVCDYPLPVELIYFGGEKIGDANLLSWITASELNTSHFELERSTDGYGFDFLAKIEANGNSNQVLNYSYLDDAPSPLLDYYRLKVIDFDGTFSYSNTIVIQRLRTTESKIYPTLFKEQVFYEITLAKPDDLAVIIYDVTGRIAHYQNLRLNSGNNKVEFNLNQLPAGSYFFKFNLKNHNVSEGHKLVKFK